MILKLFKFDCERNRNTVLRHLCRTLCLPLLLSKRIPAVQCHNLCKICRLSRIRSKGSYVQNISFSKDTGEIVLGKALTLNLEKIAEEEKYDGYYSIVTSELDMPDMEMRDIYRGLARIEETFKISKSEFDSRPVFVRTNDHIDAHFTTCFTALVLIRLLQTKLENKYPVGKIIESLKKYVCVPLDANNYQFTYFDEVLSACQKTFGMELDNRYRTRQQIQCLLRY